MIKTKDLYAIYVNKNIDNNGKEKKICKMRKVMGIESNSEKNNYNDTIKKYFAGIVLKPYNYSTKSAEIGLAEDFDNFVGYIYKDNINEFKNLISEYDIDVIEENNITDMVDNVINLFNRIEEEREEYEEDAKEFEGFEEEEGLFSN